MAYNIWQLKNNKYQHMNVLKIILSVFFFFISVFLGLIAHLLYERTHAYSDIKLNLENVLAFTPFPSYIEGADIPIYYHTTDNCTAQLFCLKEKLIPIGGKIKLNENLQSPVYSPVKGLDWNFPYMLNTKTLKSGYYLFKIISNDSKSEFNLPIIITPSKVYKVAIVANTNTWQAYNTFGGRSYYDDELTPSYILWIYKHFPKLKPLSFLPFKRPYKEISIEMENQYDSYDNFDKIENIKDFKAADLGSALLRGEWNLPGFLAKKQVEFGVYSDFDFSTNPYLDSANVILFHIHSEYWSEEMMGRLKQLIENGKKIIFLSGNNIYREIENTEYGIQVIKESIENNRTVELVGTNYTDPIFPKLAPYRVTNPNHWIFSGCNFKLGALFGKIGASGNETDKLSFFTHHFKTLAVGTNYAGPAYMVIKECENGGFVFNASSIMFAKCLQKDTIMDRIVLNLINH